MAAQKIHIVGIGGSGVSSLALYLKNIGFEVSGSDIDRDRTLELKKLGIPIADSHGAENIRTPDLVLMSPGVFAAERELGAARKKGIPVLPWQEFLGRYLERRPGKGMMIAGTYGKGSTAAILGHIVEAAYLDPLVFLGVVDSGWGSNLRVGFGDFWILEADEYNRHFHSFHPSYACLTSLEHEHISTYPTFEQYIEGFHVFFKGMKEPRIVAVKRSEAVDAALPKMLETGALTYSLTEDADIRARIVEESTTGSVFELDAPKFGLAKKVLSLGAPGRMHVENAVGAIGLALAAGIPFEAVNAGLSTFRGLRKRFEVMTRGPHTTIYDFAHTPDRIATVIEHARALFPGQRIIVLFEPHLYSRTKQYLSEFKHVLAKADQVYVVDIFPSREAASKLAATVNSRKLAEEGGRISYVGPLREGIEAVKRFRTERDVVLVLGAGPILNAAKSANV